MNYERDLLKEITQLRVKALMNNLTNEDRVRSENKIHKELSGILVAVGMNKNLFETRIFKPVADYSFMEENLRFLILLTEIVEDLNFNTRIWTKE